VILCCVFNLMGNNWAFYYKSQMYTRVGSKCTVIDDCTMYQYANVLLIVGINTYRAIGGIAFAACMVSGKKASIVVIRLLIKN
jgi:hypothetical protein